MLKVFLDANVFFAATRSASGGSRFVIELAKRNRFQPVTVAHVLAEAERNIKKKLGDMFLARHYENILSIRLQVQSLAGVTEEMERRLLAVVPLKDVPVLAGVLISGSDVLITLDRKHFIKNKKLLMLDWPFSIMTPGDFLQKYL
ncbi:MAG: PIN domain-containing protein [Patescibacteria group bacterium]